MKNPPNDNRRKKNLISTVHLISPIGKYSPAIMGHWEIQFAPHTKIPSLNCLNFPSIFSQDLDHLPCLTGRDPNPIPDSDPDPLINKLLMNYMCMLGPLKRQVGNKCLGKGALRHAIKAWHMCPFCNKRQVSNRSRPLVLSSRPCKSKETFFYLSSKWSARLCYI